MNGTIVMNISYVAFITILRILLKQIVAGVNGDSVATIITGAER